MEQEKAKEIGAIYYEIFKLEDLKTILENVDSYQYGIGVYGKNYDFTKNSIIDISPLMSTLDFERFLYSEIDRKIVELKTKILNEY